MDLSIVSNDVVVEAQLNQEEEAKRQKVLEYIRSLRAIEDAIEPYAEQKRELKAEFKEQGWLTGDEISLAVKAYRMLKKDQDIDELVEMFNFLRGDKRLLNITEFTLTRTLQREGIQAMRGWMFTSRQKHESQ